jgi:hypothetical protein
MERVVGPLRDDLLAGLTRRAVDVGAGNGSTFSHVPAGVHEVIALEPEPNLRHKATSERTQRVCSWTLVSARFGV